MPTQKQQLTRVFIPGNGFQMRTAGEVSPVYGPGWTDVPPDVLYTLSLMPAYAATDAQGRPLANSLAAASFGDRAAVAHSSMPAPDAAYGRGETFDTEVADVADPRGIHTQDAIDAARSGERTGTETMAASGALTPEPGTEQYFPGRTALSFTQRRQIREEVRRLQTAHELAIAEGNADKGSRPALVTKDAESIADAFDDEFGATDSAKDVRKIVQQHEDASDGAGVSGVAGGGNARTGRKSAGTSARKGARKRVRSARKRRRSTSSDDATGE